MKDPECCEAMECIEYDHDLDEYLYRCQECGHEEWVTRGELEYLLGCIEDIDQELGGADWGIYNKLRKQLIMLTKRITET